MNIHMKKLLLFACLVAGTAWAAQPAHVVRAYNNPQGGYVLVDADNEVLAFSETGVASADNLPLADFLRGNGMTLQVMQERLPQEIATDAELEIVVAPLLGDIEYSQDAPYNDMTPIGPNENGKMVHCVTGCVATAMAQIMAYWKYPEKSNYSGTMSYSTSYKIKEDGDATYKLDVALKYDTVVFDWSKILPRYEGVASTQEQRHQIALLMLACGVSVKMGYSPRSSGSSGSLLVAGALVDKFGYNKELKMESRSDFLDSEFIQILIDEFDSKRPVYCDAQYSGDNIKNFDGGHAFVIDGYAYAKTDTNKKKPYFHFNWGWGGKDQVGDPNLWYRLANKDITPYANKMKIIRNIMPASMTPVEETLADNMQDGRIFDILGHEVQQTIPGQLYISNGRKFIAR